MAIALLFPTRVSPSRGDEDPTYKECLGQCTERCGDPGAIQPTWGLRLMGWTCESDCRYTCMRTVVAQRRQRGQTIHQYHGKWPFVRILGLQEPASVIFSLGNAVAHWYGWRGYKEAMGHVPFFMTGLYRLNMVVCILAWLSSTIFHARDTVLTERLDYFGAFAVIVSALYYSIVRISGLRNRWFQSLLSLPFVCLYAWHLRHMLLVKFDYGWNMRVNVVIAVLFLGTWIVYLAREDKRSGRHRRQGYTFILGMVMAGSLELLDFEPILDLIDAHSLWHAATTPLTVLWYSFLAKDALYALAM